MKRLLIVYHTMTGGSEQMARAAARGAAAESDLQVQLQRAADSAAQDLLDADGYLFICPENLASMAGVMKDFFDRCYYPVLGRIEGRPYAVMVCAGSDGSGAVRQIERIATGWRLKQVAPSIIVDTDAQTAEAILAAKHIADAELQRCEALGLAMGSGLAMGIF